MHQPGMVALGWLDPTKVQLPPTSPLLLSLPVEEREIEREREPGICQKNFISITPCKHSSAEVSQQVAKVCCFLYRPHVIAASMNIPTYN
jgi:hypothetical protein